MHQLDRNFDLYHTHQHMKRYDLLLHFIFTSSFMFYSLKASFRWKTFITISARVVIKWCRAVHTVTVKLNKIWVVLFSVWILIFYQLFVYIWSFGLPAATFVNFIFFKFLTLKTSYLNILRLGPCCIKKLYSWKNNFSH